MQMSEPSLGPGLGGDEFRAVFVFRDEQTFREFVRRGWEFRTDDPGPAIEVWQLDAGGEITEPVLAGTKYWRDKDLN
jgi:hypothetical protein